MQYAPSDFADHLEEQWNIEKSRSKQSSSRNRAISNMLSLMRVAHRNEYDEDVDVAIVLDEDSAWTHMALEDEFEFRLQMIFLLKYRLLAQEEGMDCG